MLGLARLRAHAIAHTLFPECELAAALARLGFVQADPIRAPARAQDLILRQRVVGYRAGDLERAYDDAEVEEGALYAYGFLPRAIWELLRPCDERDLGGLERELLEWVRSAGPVYPHTLGERFGRGRARNDWGGYSRASTLALERLRQRGLLRVAGRRGGVRGYAAAPPPGGRGSPEQRVRTLVRVAAQVLAPVLEPTLRAIAARLRRRLGSAEAPATLLAALCRSGELERGCADGLVYLWPAGSGAAAEARGQAPQGVRFLAPFDPLVWDRRRFEALWGWPYRFEAYTPAARRVCGYYAMPMLLGDRVIGWANWLQQGGRPRVELGFAARMPRGRAFRAEALAEAVRLRAFLEPCVGEPGAGEARRALSARTDAPCSAGAGRGAD